MELDLKEAEMVALSPKKCGRLVLLGQKLDSLVQMYLKKVREGGGVVSARIAMATARGILLKYMLVEFGGHIELSQQWAHSLWDDANMSTTAKSKETHMNFMEQKNIKTVNKNNRIVKKNNKIVMLQSLWPLRIFHQVDFQLGLMDMNRQRIKWVEIISNIDKHQITAVFCGSLAGNFLPVQVIYKGKIEHCHPCFAFPSGWLITHSPKHWSTEMTMLQYVEHINLTYVEKVCQSFGADTPAVVIMDNFKGQVTDLRLLFLATISFTFVYVPQTQLIDYNHTFLWKKAAKDHIRRQFSQWYSEQVLAQLEEVSDLHELEIEPNDINMATM